ncbi:MAG: cyclase, partial [Mycobacterium sp.]|nr:cyclase [Mycobacterium sp.]
ALCSVAGDKASLAIATAGLVMDEVYQGRIRESSQRALDAMTLIEAVGDSTLTVGLSFAPTYAMIESGQWHDVALWSQRVIDLADGDPTQGNFIIGSPLAAAFTSRAMARYAAGLSGWREDLRRGLDMAQSTDIMSYATVVALVYWPGVTFGVLKSDDAAIREIEDAERIVERSGDDIALAVARMALGLALVHRETADERARGQQLLSDVAEVFRSRRHNLGDLPIVEVYSARESARHGDRDDAIRPMRAAVEQLVHEGQLLGWGVPATGVLVETLLERGADADIAEAEAAIERLADAPTEQGEAEPARDIWLLRLRALLALVRGDTAAYGQLRDSYREMADSLQFDGHIAWGEALP